MARYIQVSIGVEAQVTGAPGVGVHHEDTLDVVWHGKDVDRNHGGVDVMKEGWAGWVVQYGLQPAMLRVGGALLRHG